MNAAAFRLHPLRYWLLLAFGWTIPESEAVVSLDGSMGRSGNLNGPNYAISADLGRQVGSNLFHSFGVFDIATGEIATFSGPTSIANIISRVTGGSTSTIDGLLQSTIPGANLYLINPNGLVFGPHATLDLGGSFYGSTANYVRLADGGRFDASIPVASSLTAAPPAAFGFLSSEPTAVEVRGASLGVAPGKGIALVGGTIALRDGAVLRALGGQVALIASSAGEIVPAGQFSVGGDIVVGGGSEIDVSAATEASSSGSVFIRGGRLRMESSSLVAVTGDGAGGSVDIAVAQDAILSGGSDISANTIGAGKGGDIVIAAGGTISLSGRGRNGEYSAIHSNATGAGDAGNIRIVAPTICIDNGLVQSLTIGQSDVAKNGNGGTIVAQATNLSLLNGGQLDNGSRSGSAGNGGNIDVSARESIRITGASSEGNASLIFSTLNGNGKGGHIAIRAPQVTVDKGGQVAVSTDGAGDAGSILIEAERVALSSGGRINASTSGSGKGGAVEISASAAITVAGRGDDGSYSAIRSNTTGSGHAGSIRLAAPDVVIDDGLVQSLTIGEAGVARNGDGGSITVQASRLTLLDGGQFDNGSRSGSNANGGSIDVFASEWVRISGVSSEGYSSVMFSTLDGSGKGGQIAIRAPRLTVENGAQIAVSTNSNGEAGSIHVEAGRVDVTGGGKISANTSGGGKGGSVEISASDAITVSGLDSEGNSSVIRANTNGAGEGGSVSLTTGALRLDATGLVQALTFGSRAPSGRNGDAGNIAIHAGDVLLLGGGQIDSGSRGSSNGNGGNVEIHASGHVQVSGGDAANHSSAIFADTKGDGAGGQVRIDASSLTVSAGGSISASTSGRGAGGAILVNADSILLDDGRILASTTGRLDGEGRSGNAGSVTMRITDLTLRNGGQINSSSEKGSSGDGGGVDLTANGTIRLSGSNAAGDSSGILAQTDGDGNSGHLSLKAIGLMVENGAELITSSAGSGKGGDIGIDVSRLTVSGGGLVSSGAYGSGTGGSISVMARDSVTVSGQDIDGNFSVIRANAAGSGRGGSVRLVSSQVVVDDGAVQALTSGTGDAGTVTIQAADVALLNGGQISGSTRRANGGKGGSVEIAASDRILISGVNRDGYVSGVFANSSGAGASGNVYLHAPIVSVLDRGAVQASTTSSGNGGTVRIEGGRVEVVGGAVVSSGTSGSGGGGSVTVSAGDTLIVTGVDSDGNASAIRANTDGTGNGGNIDLHVGNLEINGGTVQSVTFGDLGGAKNGLGGNIAIGAGRVTLTNGGTIDSGSRSTSNANGGSVDVRASAALVMSGSESGIFANTFGSGEGGHIYVKTPQAMLEYGSKIQARTTGTGAGGFIQVETDSLNLSGGAFISANTSGSGVGGLVTVNAGKEIDLSGSGADGLSSSIVASTFGTGNGGNILVTAPRISMDYGIIQALTSGSLTNGAANGKAGNIFVDAGSVSLVNGAQIDSSSRAGSSGNGGSVLVSATDAIVVSGTGPVYPSAIFANTFGSGEGGFIYLKAPNAKVTVDNGAYVQAATTGSGSGGFVKIDARNLTVDHGGVINAATYGSGPGGYVFVEVADSVLVQGHDREGVSSAISAQTTGAGDGGSIYISTPQMALNGGAISSSSSAGGTGGFIEILASKTLLMEDRSVIESLGGGSGDAGSIRIKTGLLTSRASAVTTEAAHASGGNIDISATTLRLADQSAISATVGGGYGDGGNVTLTARGMAAVGNSDITARADQGHGGRITVNAQAFLRSPEVDLDASSNVIGNEGVVAVNAPKLDISGSLVVLPSNFLDVAILLDDPCAARRASEESSLVIHGRGGIPAQPDGPLPSSDLLNTPSNGPAVIHGAVPNSPRERLDCAKLPNSRIGRTL